MKTFCLRYRVGFSLGIVLIHCPFISWWRIRNWAFVIILWLYIHRFIRGRILLRNLFRFTRFLSFMPVKSTPSLCFYYSIFKVIGGILGHIMASILRNAVEIIIEVWESSIIIVGLLHINILVSKLRSKALEWHILKAFIWLRIIRKFRKGIIGWLCLSTFKSFTECLVGCPLWNRHRKSPLLFNLFLIIRMELWCKTISKVASTIFLDNFTTVRIFRSCRSKNGSWLFNFVCKWRSY